MYYRLVVIFTAVLLLLFQLCAAAAEPASTPKDFNAEMSRIESIWLPYSKGVKEIDSAVRGQLKIMRDGAVSAAPEDRDKVLLSLRNKTTWGSVERSVAYYVCAWLGVDYSRCREYLLNTAFWWERGFEKPNTTAPHGWWVEFGAEMLYDMYEYNLDFKLLHDIVTTRSDAARAELLIGIQDECLVKHPRGLLHTAEISREGYDDVVFLLSVGQEDYMFSDENLKVFRAYAQRVASDAKDPLQKLTARLLADAKRTQKR